MAQLKSSLKNMLISLTVIPLIAAAALGGVYQMTKQPIELAQKEKQNSAIKEVLKDKTAKIGKEVEINLDGKPFPYIIFPAQKDGKLVGAAIQTYTMDGYAGRIDVMVGVDAEGTISNYTILSSGETPGLGSKLADWFKTERNNQSINGKNPDKNKFSVKKDGGDFDAITASTISSRAFLGSIQSAFDAFKKYKEQK